MFQRFSYTCNDAAHAIEGFGIGRYVGQEIVTRHGRTITVTRTEGTGTLMVVAECNLFRQHEPPQKVTESVWTPARFRLHGMLTAYVEGEVYACEVTHGACLRPHAGARI